MSLSIRMPVNNRSTFLSNMYIFHFFFILFISTNTTCIYRALASANDHININSSTVTSKSRNTTYLSESNSSDLHPCRQRRTEIPPVDRLRPHDRPPALLATFDGKHREYHGLRERKRQLEARSTAAPRIEPRGRDNNNNNHRCARPQSSERPCSDERRAARTRRKRALELRGGAVPVARRQDDEHDPVREGGYYERRDNEDREAAGVEERGGSEDGGDHERGTDEVLDLLGEHGERVVFAADGHYLFEGDGQRLG